MNHPAITVALPIGHDDPSSPYWIPEEHRELYRHTAVPPEALQIALDALGRKLDTEEWYETWDRWRAEKQAKLGDREYARWLTQNTCHGDGVTPTNRSLSDMTDRDSDLFKHLDRSRIPRRPLNDVQVAEVAHKCRMAHLRPPPTAEAVAQAQEAERRRRTCSVCGCTDERLEPVDAAGAVRQCGPCRALIPLLQAALTPVPDSETRLGAILANLPDASRGHVAMTEEQLEAWAESDTSWQEFIGGAATPLAETPTVGRLQRLFGKAREKRSET